MSNDSFSLIEAETRNAYPLCFNIAEVLTRLKLNPDSWLDELKHFRSKGRTAVSTIAQLKIFCQNIKSQFIIAHTLTPILEQSNSNNFLIQ